MDFFYSPDTASTRDPPASPPLSPFSPEITWREAEAFVQSQTAGETGSSMLDPLVETLFFLYGNLYGRTKGDSCLFYPTCSHFGRSAIREHGFVGGLWMTGGRLIRAHFNFDRFYPVVNAPEGVRWFDPPAHECFDTYRQPTDIPPAGPLPFNDLQEIQIK